MGNDTLRIVDDIRAIDATRRILDYCGCVDFIADCALVFTQEGEVMSEFKQPSTNPRMMQSSIFGNEKFYYATNIPCNKIAEMSEPEIDEIVKTVVDYYYEQGFPYYEIEVNHIRREYQHLAYFDVSTLELPDNQLEQNMLGLRTANAFHKGMWSTKCKNALTPMDVFSDRKLFENAIRKRIGLSDTKLRPFNIRKSLKVFSGVQSVSNFRPTIAKWVYQKFVPKNGCVLDPCMGYGGRLLGAYTSDIGTYVATDPNKEAYQGNLEMLKTLKSIDDNGKNIQLFNEPFEDFQPNILFDLVFTSPPYFNTEKYSDQGGTQSYVRFPTYEQWVDGFLQTLISKSFDLLKDGGYLVLNVGEPIIDDTLRLARSLFGTPEIYYMRLSKILGNGKKNEVSHKLEPIFCWKKSINQNRSN